jgi:hypothetical protein
MHVLSEFYFIITERDFNLRVGIILFISASEVGIILIPWNLQGN